MNIGDKIKEQRLKKEWTQEQLAEILNVSRSTVSSWEVGRNYPDLTTIVAISDLFGISLDQLLREDINMTKDVSKKMRWNKYYKVILGVIIFMVIGYCGYNFKLRLDENRYRENLVQDGWESGLGQQPSPDIYETKENDIDFFTIVIPVKYGGPIIQNKAYVTGQKGGLTIKAYNKNEIQMTITKDNDPAVKHNGKVTVNEDLSEITVTSTENPKKVKYFKQYIKDHREAYQVLISQTLAKLSIMKS